MKKLLGLLVIAGAIVAGAVFYIGNMAKSHYDKSIQKIMASGNMIIKNQTYQKRLFDATASYDGVIPKEFFEKYFGKDVKFEDFSYRVDTNIDYSIPSVFKGVKSQSKISFSDENMSKELVGLIGTNTLLTIDTFESFNKDISFTAYTPEINKKLQATDGDRPDFVELSPIIISGNIKRGDNDEVIVKDMNASVSKLRIGDKTLTIALGDLSYSYVPQEPVHFMDFIHKVVAAKINFNLKNITIKDEKDVLILQGIETNSKISTTDKLFGSLDEVKIANINFSGVDYVKNFRLDSDLSNLNRAAFEELMNYSIANAEDALSAMVFTFFKVFDNQPKWALRNLSMENDKGEKFSMNFVLEIPKLPSGSASEFDQNMQNALIEHVKFSGEARFSSTIGKFFYNIPNTALQSVEESGKLFFVNDGNSLVSKFRYDPTKVDLIINDTHSLKELMMSESQLGE